MGTRGQVPCPRGKTGRELLNFLSVIYEGFLLNKGKGETMKKIINLVLGRILGNSCPECGRPSWNTETHCDRCGTYLDN
jgi:hypothetical protein